MANDQAQYWVLRNTRRDGMKLGSLMAGWFALCAVLGIGSIVFVVWIILKVMSHFGIIG